MGKKLLINALIIECETNFLPIQEFSFCAGFRFSYGMWSQVCVGPNYVPAPMFW